MEKLYYYIAIGIVYYGYQAYKKYQENAVKAAKAKQDKPIIPAEQKPLAQEFQIPSGRKELENRPKPLVSKSSKPEPRYIPGKTPPVSLEDLIKQFDKTGKELFPKHVEKYEDNSVKKTVKPVDKYVDEEEIARQKIEADRKAAMNQKKRERLLINEEDFAPYAKVEEKESEYVKMLKSPEGAKTAFIMTEIFNRKF
jgi:hypothetical protein